MKNAPVVKPNRLVAVAVPFRTGYLYDAARSRRGAARASARERQMLPVDLKVVILPNHLSQSHDSLVFELFYFPAAPAAKVAVAMLRIVKRIMNLIVSAGHPINQSRVMEAFEGTIHSGQIQSRQTRLRHLIKVLSGQVLMPLDLAKQLQQGRSLCGDPETMGTQEFEIVGHRTELSVSNGGFPARRCA